MMTTALFVASHHCTPEIMHLLIQYGADGDKKDCREGCTPLNYLCRWEKPHRLKAVHLLLETVLLLTPGV